MSKDIPHESAIMHVTGQAVYVGDFNPAEQVLFGRVVYSPHSHARILDYDLSAALGMKGVHAVLDYKNIPGQNQLNPLRNDEPCLAFEKVNCIGQAMFLIAAESDAIAIEAERAIKVKYEILKPILSIADAKMAGTRLIPARVFEMGNPEEAIAQAPHMLKGILKTGAQEHWYLETQAALCVPGENREMDVYASSQNPAETQMVVAEVLGLHANQVVCKVKRMGGGFGGKETQGNHVAAWAALLANATGKAVRVQLSRDDDQKITGKRHPFESEYTIAFDHQGIILGYIVDLNSDAGWAADLSVPIMERAMFHAENAYYIHNVRITGNIWKTNLPSNTAFRGFGGPQGMAVIENAIDRIARYLKKDPLHIREINFYDNHARNTTPYGQKVLNSRLPEILQRLKEKSQYYLKRKDIESFNQSYSHKKRGLACTPVKFGISFTTAFLNQAGALVMLYTDGTMMVNHGGTEMGQGLHTKILQIAALEMGLPLLCVNVSATDTSKVPNTSPTAASSGTDMNGMAVKDAIDKLKKRLDPIARKMLHEKYGISYDGELIFENGKVFPNLQPEHYLVFSDLTVRAHKERVSLAATGFYATPGVHFDRATGKGEPFYYYACGMAVSEVETDMLTGYTKVLSADIVHDVGQSINPAIDLGQVYGGFVQGLGWCTTEVIRRDAKGNLLNYSPSTYKIPAFGDMPLHFDAELLPGAPNPLVIHQSKAVGEPPFMLAFSVWLAIKDAISAVADHELEPYFELPASNELVIKAVELLKAAKEQPNIRST
ncbi:MAG TPA: xanthine dehydrogenase molybdopterin binding subunit [Bacteroidales bacterium]|nr:xanthine dehydrogenase molybdopterin binding subunit [Bacteroidales bacterium]